MAEDVTTDLRKRETELLDMLDRRMNAIERMEGLGDYETANQQRVKARTYLSELKELADPNDQDIQDLIRGYEAIFGGGS